MAATRSSAKSPSPDRLHHPLVTLVAMSPKEYQQGGKGLRIAYAEESTPFGDVFIASTSRGICACRFIAADALPGSALAELKAQWPQARFYQSEQSLAELLSLIQQCFEPLDPLRDSLRAKQALSVHVKGSNFQLQVWQALLSIPMGGILSYGDIAQRVGKSTQASRAVGTAIGQNPVAFFIPCHRVLRSSGELGGYRWGLALKRSILAWEANQCVLGFFRP